MKCKKCAEKETRSTNHFVCKDCHSLIADPISWQTSLLYREPSVREQEIQRSQKNCLQSKHYISHIIKDFGLKKDGIVLFTDEFEIDAIMIKQLRFYADLILDLKKDCLTEDLAESQPELMMGVSCNE